MNLSGTAIDSRRRILDWRDRHSINATLALDAMVTGLDDEIDELVAKADWRTVWLDSSLFMRDTIGPILEKAVNDALDYPLHQARMELGALIGDLVIDAAIESKTTENRQMDALADAAIGVTPMIAGMAVASAVPALAVSTASAGFLGLATVTVISWPVVVGVGGLAAIGFGLGIHRTAGFKDRQNKRLRNLIDTHVRTVTFDQGPNATSILKRVLAGIDSAAQDALRKVADVAA